jgi:hypothetical protein
MHSGKHFFNRGDNHTPTTQPNSNSYSYSKGNIKGTAKANDHAAAPREFGICLSVKLMELLSWINKFG